MSSVQNIFFWIKNIFNQHPLTILLGFCFLLISLIILYSKNFILLGGEGNYYVNTLLTKELYDFTWVSVNNGTGFPNPILNYTFGIFDFFYWLQFFGISLKVANVLSIFLMYALPFFSMFWLLKNILKQGFKLSFLLSLFYILNPFSTYHLHSMMFWNTAPLFVLPLLFGVLYKYYFKSLQLFLIFGFLTALLSYAFSNIPYLGIFHIFLLISIVIIYHLRSDKSHATHYRLMIKNFLLLETSFLLFNAWWLINLVRFQFQDLSLFYTKNFAINWAKLSDDEGIIGRIFSLKTLMSDADSSFFSVFYNSIAMDMILIIPFVLIIWHLFIRTDNRKKEHQRKYIIVVSFVLLVLFLNKGINQPFQDAYLWMLNTVPFFIIFKSPLEKFSVLLVFLLTIALIPVFGNKRRNWSYYAFVVYLLACSVPYLTLNFIPDFKIDEDKYVSRRYLYKESYFNAMQELNTDKLDYRYLSLPGSLNYQVTLLNHDGDKYYRGRDPLVYSINKPFIAAYSALSPDLDSIFNNFSNDLIDTSLDIYGIKKIVINRDMHPSFGFREKEKPGALLDIFSKKNEKVAFDSITVFNRENFLPHFYAAKNTIVTNSAVNQIPMLLSGDTQMKRPVAYLRNQNIGKEAALKQLRQNEKGDDEVPILEFKKINPTKYRVRMHGASGRFPFVFSESFHNGWKVYLTPSSNFQKDSNDQMSNYRILNGNEDDQANQDELKNYIDSGWVTDLGDGKSKAIKHMRWEDNQEKFDYTEKYTVDFISKNFQGTIQNDNLPNGDFWETWFKKPLSDGADHLTANGYANSWIVDADTICGQPAASAQYEPLCLKNANGTYDFEIIVEFWPQRLYYLGGIISIATLIFCLIGVGFLRRRNNNGNTVARMTEVDNSAKIEQ
ncbi:MAG: hypothetical protein AAB547_01345 [Patescibacteria group bacterium]